MSPPETQCLQDSYAICTCLLFPASMRFTSLNKHNLHLHNHITHTQNFPQNTFVSIFMRRITVLLSNFKIQFNKEQSEDGSAVTTCLLHCTLFSTIIPFNPIEPTAAADKQAKCPRTQLVVHKDNWIQLSHVRNYLQGYQ